MFLEQALAGYEPSTEMLKKVRRRCVREMDPVSNQKVGTLARDFKIQLGRENRREILFRLEYGADYA